jgi:RHS repeat-associated protein
VNNKTCLHQDLRVLRLTLVAVIVALGGVSGTLAQSKAYQATHSTERSTSFTYDPNTGLLKSEKIEPNKADLCVNTRYEHDAYGNRRETTVESCAGASSAAAFQARITSIDHVSLVQGGLSQPAGVVAGVFPMGASNALGHSEYKTFDPRFGQPLSQKGPNGLTTSWALDSFGRPVAETRSDGSVTRTWYCEVSDAFGSAPRNSNTNATNTPSHANLPNCDGLSTAFGLIGAGTPGEVLHAAGISHFVHVQAYLPNGQVAGPFTRTYYDVRSREVRSTTQAFDGGSGATSGRLIVKDTHYHPSGATAATTQPYFWNTKSSVVASDAADTGYGYSYTEYDVLGRPKAIYTADALAVDSASLVDMPSNRPTALPARKSSRVSYSYSGLATTLQRAALVEGTVVTVTETQEKNPEDKIVRTTDSLGAQQVFEYDAAGNLRRTFDAMGSGGGSSLADANIVAIDYDDRGRKTALNDPNKGVWQYKYNALGELVEQVDGNNKTTTFKYDKLGRLVVRDTPDHFARYHFDVGADGLKCSTATASLGLLCASTTRRDGQPASGTLERRRSYDDLLRPTGETTLVYAGSGAVERRFASTLTYNATTARLQSQSYPTGLSVGFEYTALGFVNRVGDWAGGAITAARWTAGDVNAWGKSERYTVGNNVVHKNQYEPHTGRARKAGAGTVTTDNVFSHRYAWDTRNNLITRADAFGSNGAETQDNFFYDALNRLARYQVIAPPQTQRDIRITYNAVGNILHRSDVGHYSYRPSGSATPHAVYAVRGAVNVDYTYDGVGNMRTASAGAYQSVTYNSFNQPDGEQGILGRNGTRYTYQYDDAQQRVLEKRTLGSGAVRVTYKLHPDNAGGLGFEQEREAGAVVNRHYVSAGGMTVAMVQTAGEIYAGGNDAVGGTPQLSASAIVRVEYWHKDHLGSIVAVTDASATVRARYAYDPWGQRRNPDGSFANLAPGDYPNGTDRGFTGHEHLDDVGIIHMNGRLYDPLLARFMQADPVVQAPFLMQNYNAYSYALNNPLNATDPDGRFFWFVVGAVVAARALGIIDQKTFRGLLGIAVAVALGPGGALAQFTSPLANTALSGFASGAVSSGNLKGAFQGMLTGMLFYGAGKAATSAFGEGLSLGRVAMHSLAGCVSSAVSGGSCEKGALNAGITKALSGLVPGDASREMKALGNALIGGTVSKLGGGKFSNGALTGAMQYLFNQAVEDMQREMRERAFAGLRGALKPMQPYWEKVFGPDRDAPMRQVSLAPGATFMVGPIGASQEYGVSSSLDSDASKLIYTKCVLGGLGIGITADVNTAFSLGSPGDGWQVSLFGKAALPIGGFEFSPTWGSDGPGVAGGWSKGFFAGAGFKYCVQNVDRFADWNKTVPK